MMDVNNNIPQDDFFVTLHGILAEKEEVTELQPVPDAHVPVLKFKFRGISIDLLYASLSLSVIPAVSHSIEYFYVLMCPCSSTLVKENFPA
jgi:poly(A) polymerase Pap1